MPPFWPLVARVPMMASFYVNTLTRLLRGNRVPASFPRLQPAALPEQSLDAKCQRSGSDRIGRITRFRRRPRCRRPLHHAGVLPTYDIV